MSLASSMRTQTDSHHYCHSESLKDLISWRIQQCLLLTLLARAPGVHLGEIAWLLELLSLTFTGGNLPPCFGPTQGLSCHPLCSSRFSGRLYSPTPLFYYLRPYWHLLSVCFLWLFSEKWITLSPHSNLVLCRPWRLVVLWINGLLLCSLRALWTQEMVLVLDV